MGVMSFFINQRSHIIGGPTSYRLALQAIASWEVVRSSERYRQDLVSDRRFGGAPH